MTRYVFAAAVLAASFTVPLAEAHAGFLTDVAKGAISNAARHGKKTVKDAVAIGRFVAPSVGRCLLSKVKGGSC